MKNLKMLAVALGAVATVSSAVAIPTMVVSDGSGGGLTLGPVTTPGGGIVTYNSSDSYWTVVVSIGTSYPPLNPGNAQYPYMDLSITATSIGNTTAHPLSISFGSDSFGPTFGTISSVLSGHVVSGTGQSVTYTTYYDTANRVPTQALPNPGATLTTSGPLSAVAGFYAGSQGAALNASFYSLDEVVTIAGGTVGGSYSLDASLHTTAVPDGGTTVMLLGAALSGLAFLRRKIA